MTDSTSIDGDTIAAVATAPGRGGVGIVRISGPEALAIGTAISGAELQPRHAHFGPFRDEHGSLLDSGPNPGDIALLKVQASETMEFCAREAMQILGGIGYMRGNRVERIYREVRVNAIGGGSEEIMRDLATRQYRV